MKTLVLGMGNELYGDDGVGIHAVRILKTQEESLRRAGSRCEVDFKECGLSGIGLLDVITGYDALVIIDTIVRPQPATGRARVLDASDVRDVPGPSPHYISVPQTIEIGRRLGLHVPGFMKIVAVEAKDLYTLGEGLSGTMKTALPGIVARTISVLRSLEERAARMSRPDLEAAACRPVVRLRGIFP